MLNRLVPLSGDVLPPRDGDKLHRPPESVINMARVCLAVDRKDIPLLAAALKGAGEPGRAVLTHLDVATLGKLAPDILIADIDQQKVDSLEMLRQLRFVLPECVIVVYTGAGRRAWARACHLAGASCVLSKESREPLLVSGLQYAIQSGCFTDPRLLRSVA